jgi:hypothetical protein
MHELGMIGIVAVVCAVLAWRADEKAVRRFFIGACLVSLLGGLVAAQEGNFWKSKPRAETAADKAQNECAVNAYKAYLSASLVLYQQEGVASSIGGVVAKRRLMEGYCVQFVQCLNVPAIAMGAMFSKCLDDEDEDRLNDSK